MTKQPAVVMKEIVKSFGKKNVLKGVSGNIMEGSVVAILGRNGEGKTTLLKILMDLLGPDSGTAEVMGMKPNGSGAIRQHVGYIPERPAFHEFLTAGEVLHLRAGLFNNWDRKKAGEMARELDLDLSTQVKGASKGTLAKLAWICATAHRPRLLLMDEPTSGLDLVVRDAVIKHFVREMAEEGKTIVITSHHIDELFGVLQEVWTLSNGRVHGRYSLEDLRHNALRISGRLKSEIETPKGVIEERRIGEVVQWMVLDKESLSNIRSAEFLENMHVEPLPLEAAFRALLSRLPAPV